MTQALVVSTEMKIEELIISFGTTILNFYYLNGAAAVSMKNS